MRDIVVARQLISFARVLVLSLHTKILEMQAEHRNQAEFEEGYLKC